MTEEILIRVCIVVIVIFLLLYQLGYRDKFPFIGKHLWTERPFYQEIFKILMMQVERFSFGADLPEESLQRIHSTVDMILEAFNKDYDSIEVNLPSLDVGVQFIDFYYKITRYEVLNIHIDNEN